MQGFGTSESHGSFPSRFFNSSQIYICATAHISKLSQKDVEDIIADVAPSIIVLELDPDRMQRLVLSATFGDRFGLRNFKTTTAPKIMSMALSGDLLGYASGLFYVCTGALMGTRPGGEFLAASDAAERVGAQIMFGDRSQDVTMKRLQWYTRKLLEAERGSGIDGVISTFPTTTTSSNTDSNSAIDGRSGTSAPSPDALQAKAEVDAAINPEDNVWGLEEDASTERAMKARLLRMMREGGCLQPNAVLEAAQRLLRGGLDPEGSIAAADVLQVRACGSTLIEQFRQRALQGDDSWAKELEIESVTGAKGALGVQRKGEAMRKVIIDERDWILARRLWEAGEAAAGGAVVGVCGAGHVRGIVKYWNVVGSPEAAARVDEYCQLPPGVGPPSVVGMALTTGVLGFMAYRRPKAMAVFGGAVALATAPYLGFSVVAMRRMTQFAEKLVNTVKQIDSSSGDVGGAAMEGWPPQESEWQ